MPNIDDSTPINVQLYNETDGVESKKMKFQGENQEEVRSLLEYMLCKIYLRVGSGNYFINNGCVH